MIRTKNWAIDRAYELNPLKGSFSVIVPRAASNLVPNPDMELSLLGWNRTFGSVVAADYSVQLDPTLPYSGAYSLTLQCDAGSTRRFALISSSTNGIGSLTPNISVTAGRRYTLSLRYRTSGLTGDVTGYIGYWSALNTGQTFTSATVSGMPNRPIQPKSSWTKVSVSWVAPSTQSISVIFGFGVAEFPSTRGQMWIDEVQLEEGARESTFITGTRSGLGISEGDYAWMGAPGNSVSVRSASCVRGGDVVNLKDLGFKLLGHNGLGLPSYTNVLRPVSTGGAFFSETLVNDYTFQLLGRIDGRGQVERSLLRRRLIRALQHDRAGLSQPVTLRYQLMECEDELSSELDIVCVLESGLEGQGDALLSEDLILTFRNFRPALLRPTPKGRFLSPNDGVNRWGSTVVHNRITKAMETQGFTNYTGARVLRNAKDGTFWLGGGFSNLNGVAANAGLVKWDPNTDSLVGWGTITLGGGNGVEYITDTPGDALYAHGTFTGFAGSGSVANLARYSKSANAWTSYGNPNGRVRAVIEVPGRVYVMGDYTAIGGVPHAGAAYTTDGGTLWTTPTFAASNVVTVDAALYDLRTNRLYYAVTTSVPSTQLGYIDLATGTATAIQTHFGSTNVRYHGIFILANGDLVVCRNDSSSGTTSGLFRYVGGTQLDALALYPSGVGADTLKCWQDSKGQVWLSQPVHRLLGDRLSPIQAHYWDGSQVRVPPMRFGASAAKPLTFYDTNDVYEAWGFSSEDYWFLPVVTVVDDVLASSSVVLEFHGTGELYSIENLDTGETIEFNVQLRPGETVTVDTSTGKAVSSVSGSIVNGLISRASMSTWRLVGGSNRVRLAFWPIFNNDMGNYQTVFTGTATPPGTGYFSNAHRGTTGNGKIFWTSTAADAGSFYMESGGSIRTAIENAGGINLVATTDLPISMNGFIDLVPGASGGTGMIWTPMAHMYYESSVPSIDMAVELT